MRRRWLRRFRPDGTGYDPHSERGSACPKNFFGLTDYAELSRRERVFSARRIGDLERGGVQGPSGAAYLRRIHWSIVRDVFPWAGELRRVGLSKAGGASFAAPQFIASALDELLSKLKDVDPLRGVGKHHFAERAGFFLGEINAIHPFREGNGRTQREFVRQLAANAGHTISWAGFTQEQMDRRPSCRTRGGPLAACYHRGGGCCACVKLLLP